MPKSQVPGGNVLVNGRPITADDKREIGYVLQEDHLFTELTVKETLEFAALMRLPREMSREDKLDRVERMMSAFGLSEAKNTKIGGVSFAGFTPGVSGGEKKRASIANEMLFDPSLLFLDEPTSGLDASTALKIVKELRVLASSGRTVVTTIHSPSSQIFAAFDLVCLMAEGSVAYFGPASRVVEYYEHIGLRPPIHFNPADFMLEVVSSPLLKDKYDFAEEYSKNAEKFTPPVTAEDRARDKQALLTPQSKHRYQATAVEQLKLLTVRSFKVMRGDIFTKLNVVQYTAIAVICSLLWFRIEEEASTINDRVGLIFFLLLYFSFDPIFASIMLFSSERTILAKERQADGYSLLYYFLAKSVSTVPTALAFPTAIAVLVYFTAGLRLDILAFLTYLVIIWLQVLASQSVGMLVGSLILNMKKAMITVGVVLLGMVLTGGFYININNMPAWISWVRYISIFKYGYEGLLLNEISGQEYPCDDPNSVPYASCPVTEAMIKDFYAIDLNIGWNLLISFVIGIVIRTASYFALKHNKASQEI